MFVTFSDKTVTITSIRSTTGDVRTGPSSTSAMPCDTGPLGERTEPRGAEENNENIIGGARPDAEVPVLTQASLKGLENNNPVAATLASVLSSLPPSKATPIARLTEMTKVANAKVEACVRPARKGKGKAAALGPMFWAMWRYDTFEIPYDECDVSASAHASEWEPGWMPKEPTPSNEPSEPECLEREAFPKESGSRTFMSGSGFAFTQGSP